MTKRPTKRPTKRARLAAVARAHLNELDELVFDMACEPRDQMLLDHARVRWPEVYVRLSAALEALELCPSRKPQ